MRALEPSSPTRSPTAASSAYPAGTGRPRVPGRVPGSDGAPGRAPARAPAGAPHPAGLEPDATQAGTSLAADLEAPRPNEHPAGSTLRRQILTRLRQDGPMSPDSLAANLGVSRTGVLQQLRALQSAQLISRQTVRHGVGRPRHLYDVTPDAQDLFPSNYDSLASDLLTAIDAIGGDHLVRQVFGTRRRQIAQRVKSRFADRLPADATLRDRVRELAVLQNEQGYLCAVELFDGEAGPIRLREHNCAIYHVAVGRSAPCEAELELFREVLGTEVVRETHIAAGDRCCTYRVIEPAD